MINFAGQGSDVSGMSTTASSWHYSPSHPGIADFSPLLKKYAYQLSCVGEFGIDVSISCLCVTKLTFFL